MTSNNGNIYPISPLDIFALTSMPFSDLLFFERNDRWLFEDLLERWVVLYQVPFFH